MILTKLVDLYDQLATSSDEAVQENLPRYGFSLAKVVHEFALNEAGEIVGYRSLRREIERTVGYDKAKEQVKVKKVEEPTLMVVPEQKSRSSAVTPYFLCDTLTYVLGVSHTPKKPETAERKMQKFEAAKELHLQRIAKIGDPLLAPVERFYRQWQPANFEQYVENNPALWANWQSWEDGLAVFRLPDGSCAHALESVKQQAIRATEGSDGRRGLCLVTGQQGVLIENLHPNVKMPGGGSKFVSYNSGVFTSYNKKDGDNAPIGRQSAFKFTEALNALIGIKNQRITMGDTTVVFWATATSQYESQYAELINPNGYEAEAEKQTTEGVKERLISYSQQLVARRDRQARRQINAHLPTKTDDKFAISNDDGFETEPWPFYVLGLEPNMQRLGVRFFWQSTVADSVEIVAMHYEQLELVRFAEKQPAFIPLNMLVRATKSAMERDFDPLVASNLLQAVVTGQRYHASLLAHVLGKMRRDHDAGYVRVALIKAILWRNHEAYLLQHPSLVAREEEDQIQNQQRRLVVLNEEVDNIGYLSGRLFAVLERAQDIAINANASISDRYLGAAATRPATVFPLLMKLNIHHLSKIGGGLKVNMQREIERIAEGIGIIDNHIAFPRVLSLEEQGLFFVGYYHQRAAMSERLKSAAKEETDGTNELAD